DKIPYSVGRRTGPKASGSAPYQAKKQSKDKGIKHCQKHFCRLLPIHNVQQCKDNARNQNSGRSPVSFFKRFEQDSSEDHFFCNSCPDSKINQRPKQCKRYLILRKQSPVSGDQYYPQLTRAHTVRTGLFQCPAALLFSPRTSSTRRSSALQGTETAA